MPLDDELLAEYMTTFYGYGTYRGEWWLVGMEEGGGDSVNDITSRLTRWNGRGRKELEDVDLFAGSPSHEKWFTRSPPLQPTWAKLIRLILSAEGRPVDSDAIRAYQGAHLGRLDSNNCILELLPLPSPSIGHWIYGEHSRLADLRDRRTYTERIAPSRVEHLRQRIVAHKPKAVIFYSRSPEYRKLWEQLAGTPFQATELAGLDVATSADTVFAVTRHPTHMGVTNDYFARAGALIAVLAGKARRG